MLTYTFSKREKVLIFLMAIVLVVVVWYKFIYEGVQNQLSSLETEIANAQDALVIDTYKVTTMKQMEGRLAAYEGAGAKVKTMPYFDNIQPLSTELNEVLGQATAYTLKFDEMNRDGSPAGSGSGKESQATASDVVQRGVSLSFDCGSYATARTILSALVDGDFPCTIDSLSIADSSVSNGSRRTTQTDVAFSVKAHLTFYERLTSEQLRANAAEAAAEEAAKAASES